MMMTGTEALRESRRAPVIFVPTPLISNRSETRGTCIRSDGRWEYGKIDAKTESDALRVFPLATILVVHTDSEDANAASIGEWMRRECFEIQKRMKDDCFVLSKHTYEPFKSSLDARDFVRWESSLKKIVRHAVHVRGLESSKPTFATTSSPVVPSECVDRIRDDCSDPCAWYGAEHGCQIKPYCGFQTKFACEHHSGCVMIRNRCRKSNS